MSNENHGENALKKLREIDREQRLLGHTAALLGWDQQTCMPPKAVEERGDQLALVSGLMHDRMTQPQIGESLGQLGVEFQAAPRPTVPESIKGIERAFLLEMARQYRRSSALPRRLVTELARETAIGQQIWMEARKAADFQMFSGQLGTILGLVREVSSCLGYQDHPYDPLLDEYEPWMSTAEVENVFSGLRPGLIALLDKIRGSGKKVDAGFLSRDFQIGKQKAFGLEVLTALGYEFERGRLDESAHPFTTTLGSSDVRITTRYAANLLPMSIFGTIHECGHGLYELGFDPEIRGTLLAEGASLGLHESQSRMMENMIGRSLPFWSHFYPRLKAIFPDSLADVDLRRFYEGVNRVAPSFIRVEADEVTYNLHIILRFELEKRLVSGDLAVADLPEAWNSGMQELLDLTPPDDAQGVLQDIHWSGGMIGYFPTYSLGNLYAAQFFGVLSRDLPDWSREVEEGRFHGVLEWLRENIHKHGRVYPAKELCRRISGQDLDPRYLLGYLAEKFGQIYGF